MGSLQEELEHRAREGDYPLSVRALNDAFLMIGYGLDRSMDCRGTARWMTGPRAGASYPCVTTGICEADTGMRAFHFAARRDANFARLQEMRRSGRYFAVSRGAILEP